MKFFGSLKLVSLILPPPLPTPKMCCVYLHKFHTSVIFKYLSIINNNKEREHFCFCHFVRSFYPFIFHRKSLFILLRLTTRTWMVLEKLLKCRFNKEFSIVLESKQCSEDFYLNYGSYILQTKKYAEVYSIWISMFYVIFCFTD